LILQDARVWGSDDAFNPTGIMGITSSFGIYEAWVELKIEREIEPQDRPPGMGIQQHADSFIQKLVDLRVKLRWAALQNARCGKRLVF